MADTLAMKTMNQIFKDLTTLDNMMLRLRVAEVTFECLFSLNPLQPKLILEI